MVRQLPGGGAVLLRVGLAVLVFDRQLPVVDVLPGQGLMGYLAAGHGLGHV